MKKFGDVLSQKRQSDGTSLKKASKKLLIKETQLSALENHEWDKLPEPTYVKGYIRSYAEFLNLNPEQMLALYRREFVEEKKISKNEKDEFNNRNLITPTKLKITVFVLAVTAFISYIAFQYSSVFSSPDVDIFQPIDDVSVSVPVIEIVGKAEAESQVSIDGVFVPIDQDGNFSYIYDLSDGENNIEIIASKRLSPKTKIQRTIRLLK